MKPNISRVLVSELGFAIAQTNLQIFYRYCILLESAVIMNEDKNDAIEVIEFNLTLSGVFYGETVIYTPLPDLPADLHTDFTCIPFFRFFNDGVVISVTYDHEESDITNIWSNDMNEWFNHEYENRGTYYLSDTNIEFFTKCHLGIVEYKGNYVGEKLILSSFSHINGSHAANLKYIRLTNS